MMDNINECRIDSKQQEDLEILANSNEIDFTKYENKTIFITGTTGFIGSSLEKTFLCISRIKNIKINVIAAVRNKEKAERTFRNLLTRDNFQLYVGDIVDSIEIVDNVDYIFHTASVTTSRTMIESPVETIEIAYQGTRNILELARQKQVDGVVYISSMEVYGVQKENIRKVSENDLGYIEIEDVRSCYPESKRICECLCNSYAREYGVPVKSARLAQTFGAGILSTDNRVYAQFAKCVISREDIVLHTDGLSEGNYCYIRDAIKALLMLGYSGNNGEAYNIVNENTHMTVKDMANLVSEEIAKNQIRVIIEDMKSNKYGYAPSVKMRLDGSKISDLGWRPEVGIKEMYERMIFDMRLSE